MIDDITASTMCKADEKSTAYLVFSPQTQDSVCIYTVYSAEGLVPELECFGTWFTLVPSRVPSSSKRSVEAGLTRNCAKYGNANVLSLVAWLQEPVCILADLAFHNDGD